MPCFLSRHTLLHQLIRVIVGASSTIIGRASCPRTSAVAHPLPVGCRMASTSCLRVDAIPAFTDNYIWCITGSKAAVLVDPGDAKPAIEYLEKQDVALAGVLITHHHADHVGGLHDLVAWGRARGVSFPVYGPATERIPERTHAVREGDEVRFDAAGVTLRVLEVPGHTLGHVAYVVDAVRTALHTL